MTTTGLGTHLRVNKDRLWNSLMEISRFGATENGGVTRLTLSKEAGEVRDLLIGYCKAEGCSITVDGIGNVFALRPGKDPSRPVVSTGSHIDTQPKGGKFDGNYGVMAGLEVLRTLNENGVETTAPVELCIWTNEEGSRFTPTMMGSAVYTGDLSLEAALAKEDENGIKAGDAVKAIGYDGKTPASVKDGAPLKGAYFEAHIEQGPILDKLGLEIGVVTGALGQYWYDVEITGTANHAGTTPMDARRDPMQTAGELITETIRISRSHGEDGRGTVGHMRVYPNARNVIPAKIKMTVDLRHSRADDLHAMEKEFRDLLARLEEKYGTPVAVQKVTDVEPPAFDPELVGIVRNAAQNLGYTHRNMVSGAGHDAVQLARTVPVAMIFVPTKDGISHNEAEYASPEELERGANVLLQAMLAKSL